MSPSPWAMERAASAHRDAAEMWAGPVGGSSRLGALSDYLIAANADALDAARAEGRAEGIAAGKSEEPPSAWVRLETWSNGHKARTVSVYSPDGYGAGCWSVTLGHERGVTVADEAGFWTWPEEKGGEAAYRAEAERQGFVFAPCPDDEAWAGLERTIAAALNAFDRGVWGPRNARHDIPEARPIRKHTEEARAEGIAQGRLDERAAVVAEGRAGMVEAGDSDGTTTRLGAAMRMFLDYIERGDHVAKEKA